VSRHAITTCRPLSYSPGERAAQEAARRKQNGLPIDAPTWARIQTFLAELGIEKDHPVRPAAR